MAKHLSNARYPNWLIEAAPRIIGQHGIKDKNAKMDNLEVDGYYIQSDGALYFAKFTKTCVSPDEYKSELVKHAHLYRDFELS